MSLMRSALNWLPPALQSAGGQTVIYRRLDGTERPLTAVRGRHEQEERDGRNVTTIVRTPDWLIKSEDFRSAFGTEAEPRDGDEVVADGRRYVVGPIRGEECFRRSDHGGVIWRLHTKDHGPDGE